MGTIYSLAHMNYTKFAHKSLYHHVRQIKNGAELTLIASKTLLKPSNVKKGYMVSLIVRGRTKSIRKVRRLL